MSKDPFLRAHQIKENHYDIGSSKAPIAIRDQMFRGWTAVKRAFKLNIINKKRPLLVVGAGVGGVTAALTAAGLKIPTTIIEKSVPFGRQKGCSSRFICPTQYDWPLCHWRDTVFPWSSQIQLPLTYTADNGAELAKTWRRELQNALSKYKHLSMQYGTADNFMKNGHNLITYRYTDKSGQSHTQSPPVGMILSSKGFGIERTWFPTPDRATATFNGLAFWDVDSLKKPRAGCSSTGHKHVLIAGGGDGALQDYLRAICGKPASVIYDTILQATGSFFLDQEKRIQSKEDLAMRHWALNTKAQDPDLYQTLDDFYTDLVQAAFRNPHITQTLGRTLEQKIIKQTILSQQEATKLSVHLVYREPWFTRAYPLNRLLTLIVATYLKEAHQINTLFPNTTIHAINASRHQCDPDKPRACLDKKHEVSFITSEDELHGDLRGKPVYEVIVLRFGVESFSGEGAPEEQRQLLPYCLLP